MPDWFYRTVSRPLLYRMKPRTARSFALGFMGKLSRMPFGPRVIDLLGHMRPDRRLATTVLGFEFASPIGLGPRLDPDCVAIRAFERFGVGFVDVGAAVPALVDRDDSQEEIAFHGEPRTADPASWRGGTIPRILRVDSTSPEGDVAILASAAPRPPDPDRPCLQIVSPDEADLEAHVEAGLAAGYRGVLIDGAAFREGRLVVGRYAFGVVLEAVKKLRARFGANLAIVAGGGVHEVGDALALIQAGATLIEIDTGLVFNGPGLVKRINEALLHRVVSQSPPAPAERPASMTWFWTALLGLGMFFGGILALIIAATRVLLPYDEAFLGLTRDQLHEVNPRLLAFLAHDRVSLVGPMLALGILYLGLSLGGIRRGMHWAMVAVLASAATGFASFFLFLGFGYLDPLHAFVTACLLQFLLLAIHLKLGESRPEAPPLRTDRAWRLAQWGQLLLVCHSVAVLVAGLVISTVGVTVVFVHEDLEFLRTTSEALTAANPKILPLIAHDRATFGGMLVCTGLVLLLTSLWGTGPARPWLWRTLMAAGFAGYLPAIGVHLAVGY